MQWCTCTHSSLVLAILHGSGDRDFEPLNNNDCLWTYIELPNIFQTTIPSYSTVDWLILITRADNLFFTPSSLALVKLIEFFWFECVTSLTIESPILSENSFVFKSIFEPLPLNFFPSPFKFFGLRFSLQKSFCLGSNLFAFASY